MKPKYYIYPNRKPEDGETVFIFLYADFEMALTYVSNVGWYTNWLWRYA